MSNRDRGKTVEPDASFIFKETDAAAPTVDQRTKSKEFVVEHEDTGLYVIKYTAGGEVPDTLKGRWTNLLRAEQAIENFQVTRAQQEALKLQAKAA